MSQNRRHEGIEKLKLFVFLRAKVRISGGAAEDEV